MRSTPACLLLCSFVLALSARSSLTGGEGGGGIVTLYAHDDLQSSFDFRGGGPGGRVVDGEVRLDNAQIAFDVFAPGRISFGFSRDERVEVLDLGAAVIQPEARARDRAEEFPMSVFHTLFRGDAGFAIVGPGGDVDPYDRADRILTETLTQGIRHVEPQLEHTYVLRVRRNDTSKDELFKFEVVGFVPDQSLTLRWAPVPGR